MPKIYNLLYIFIYTLNKNLKQNKNYLITAELLLHLMSNPRFDLLQYGWNYPNCGPTPTQRKHL